MPNSFHNPFHFIPVKKLTIADKKHGLVIDENHNITWGPHAHDQYTDKTFSGRLICKLTTESPIFIGAQQKDGTEPKQVIPFEIDGKPVIPGSTLRGMLSSLSEAASNSALRVLHRDKPLSYRRTMLESLSAVGMIIEQPQIPGEFFLLPLALPTIERRSTRDAFRLPSNYHKMFPNPRLKVLLDGYDWRRQRDGKKLAFASGDIAGKQSYAPRGQHYFMLLNKGWIFQNGEISPHPQLRFPSKKKRDRNGEFDAYLIGQKPLSVPNLKQFIDLEEWNQLPPVDQNKYTRGILRILGAQGRADMPTTKKHELFIPFPDGIGKEPIYRIPQPVIKRFTALADERTEANPQHPYEPLGTRQNRNGQCLKLHHGDIVFFRPNTTGTEVEDISFSSIWRGHAGTVEDYFRAIDVDVLPFTQKRTTVTPAELLFGFVQDEKENDEKSTLAFKGKIRVSFGKIDESFQDNFYDSPVTLKILSSPKPPSPALYFKFSDESEKGDIAKSALKPGKHHPQGRKIYLHHHLEEGITPWKSLKQTELNQKNRIEPLRKGLEFYFHLDFNNLTKWELGLLCYAVRPTDKYRHKIGMGKPLGLGTIRIDPLGLFTIDRSLRYSEKELSTCRYNQSWTCQNVKLPSSYGDEQMAISGGISFDDVQRSFTESMDSDIRNAIQLLGEPQYVTHPVHTPQVAPKDLEEETYCWFVANDVGSGTQWNNNRIDAKNKSLIPLNKDSKVLPLLVRYDWNN